MPRHSTVHPQPRQRTPRPALPLCHDSPHKCMFPGFLVVRRMNYGRSATNARLRRRDCEIEGGGNCRRTKENWGKSGTINSFKKNGGISRCFLCCSFLARRITVLISSNRLVSTSLTALSGQEIGEKRADACETEMNSEIRSGKLFFCIYRACDNFNFVFRRNLFLDLVRLLRRLSLEIIE